MSECLEIYEVSFSFGPDPNNVAYKFSMLGRPTEQKIKGYLSTLIDQFHSIVWLNTGLPTEKNFLFVCSHCLYLLNRFGLPPIGLSDQCVTEEYAEPFVMGHISTMKIGSVYDIGE